MALTSEKIRSALAEQNSGTTVASILAATPTDVDLRDIDSLLLGLSRGTLTADRKEQLRLSIVKFGLTDKFVVERQKLVVERKDAEVKARQERERPAFAGPGVVVVNRHQLDQFAVWGDTSIQPELHIKIDVLIAGDRALPCDLANIKWYRGPSDSDESFEAMVDILKKMDAGEIKPGPRVRVLRRTKSAMLHGAIPSLFMDKPEHIADAATWDYKPIRHPSQSEREFSKLAAELNSAIKRYRQEHGDRA